MTSLPVSSGQQMPMRRASLNANYCNNRMTATVGYLIGIIDDLLSHSLHRQTNKSEANARIESNLYDSALNACNVCADGLELTHRMSVYRIELELPLIY